VNSQLIEVAGEVVVDRSQELAGGHGDIRLEAIYFWRLDQSPHQVRKCYKDPIARQEL